MTINSGSQSLENDESFLSRLLPLVVPGGWYVQRNLLSKDILSMEESPSSQWDWLFSAINFDGNLEVEVLGEKQPLGLCLAGAVILLSGFSGYKSNRKNKRSSQAPSAKQLFKLKVESVENLDEIAILVKTLFEKAIDLEKSIR